MFNTGVAQKAPPQKQHTAASPPFFAAISGDASDPLPSVLRHTLYCLMPAVGLGVSLLFGQQEMCCAMRLIRFVVVDRYAIALSHVCKDMSRG